MIDWRGEKSDQGAVRSDAPLTAQVAGALAAFTLNELQPLQPAMSAVESAS
jgi:hypothetical protein